MDGFEIHDPAFRTSVLPNAPLEALADGFRAGEHGSNWSSAGDGVHCISPSGTLLGVAKTGGTTLNLAFGGRNRSRPFICASHRMCAILLNVRGAQRP